MNTLTFSSACQSFSQCGINQGDSILVHSALRPFGKIDGGKATIARALLNTVGEQGTLIAPAFTFKHELEETPIIDPLRDPSEMGAISETIRNFPGSARSAAYRHSVSAVGPYAHVITDVDPSLSVFDMRSSFGRMLALDVKIVLAGLGYDSCTSIHFAEHILQVPYRHTLQRSVKLRKPDGTEHPMYMTDYQPKDSEDEQENTYDFNRIGRMLEDQGLVTVAPVGNAVIRTFRMRDLINTILYAYPLDPTIFFAKENEEFPTPLNYGKLVSTGDLRDGANRLVETYWACLREEDMFQV